MPTDRQSSPQDQRRQGIGVVSCALLVGMQNARTASCTTASAQTGRRGSPLMLCFAQNGGCIQVGFLSEIRARAGLRTIFETSNLDACDSACTIGSAQAPRPFGGHRENVRSGNRLPAPAFNKGEIAQFGAIYARRPQLNPRSIWRCSPDSEGRLQCCRLSQRVF